MSRENICQKHCGGALKNRPAHCIIKVLQMSRLPERSNP